MKKILNLLMFILMCGFLFGCNTKETAERTQSNETNRRMTEMQSTVGMPVIYNMFEKKQAKWIFEARDNAKLVTYAYAFSDYHGKFVFINKCIGYGLPYSVQYTNPMKITDTFGRPTTSRYEGFITPQVDPNGLYMPEGLSATWLFMINPETKEPEPVYMESTITVTPFPLDKRICLGGINF